MSSRRNTKRQHYRGEVLLPQLSIDKYNQIASVMRELLTKNSVAEILSFLNVTDAAQVPSLTGDRASGTWGINVTGWASELRLSGLATHKITYNAWAGTAGYPGYAYTGPGDSRFGFSSANGKVDVYTDGEFYAAEGVYKCIHTGDYNSYCPTLAGGGAYGTWNIGISGNAATATELRPGHGQGIVWPADTYGGSGDSASITQQTNGGESTRIVIKVTNDEQDGVDIVVPSLNSFLVNGYVALNVGNYNSYAPSLTGSGASGTWTINVTGKAGSVDWSGVLNKPATYSPSVHTHAFSDLHGLPSTAAGHGINDVVLKSSVGVAGGVVPLNGNTKIDASYLPSYVDDVLEYSSVAALPSIGESGKIYITTDTNPNGQYRWTGSGYLQLNNAVSASDTTNRLATARTISSYGDASWSVSFNGSGDVSGQMTLTNVIGAGTINTSSQTIRSLTYDAKGRIISVGSEVTITPDWNSVVNKPSTYPPSGHSHSFDSITGKPSTYPPSTHTHSFSSLSGIPTTLSGYGITDSVTANAFGLLTGRVATVESALFSKFITYPIAGGFYGKPPANALAMVNILVDSVTFPTAFSGSRAKCLIAPKATTTFNVTINGEVLGQIVFNSGSYVGTFTNFGNVRTFEAGAVVEVQLSGGPDATFSGLYFTIKAYVSF